MPLVSVIIASYNHEKYVAECIQSILDQTFQDFEIIITDDGSRDATVQVIEAFSDPRIRLFKHTKNQGAVVAANNCYLHSSGKYIANISSDDAWYPQKLAVQVDFMEKHPEIGIVFAHVDWIDESGNLLTGADKPYLETFNATNRSCYEWLRYFFYKGNNLCAPSSLIRRECVPAAGMLNPAMANIPDFDLWVRICLRAPVKVLEQKLVRFRKMSDNSNASGNTGPNNIRIRFEYGQVLNNYLGLKDPQEFLAIFPEADNYGPLSPETIPYFLGRLAIEDGFDFKVLWGLNTIFALLQDPKMAARLESECGFTYMDFVKLACKVDVFKTVKLPQTELALQKLSAESAEKVAALSAQVAEGAQALAARDGRLLEIETSSAWRVVLKLRRVRDLLLPPGSRRLALVKKTFAILFYPFSDHRDEKIERDLVLIRDSGFFDPARYLAENPDVAKLGMEPARHYLLHGGFEGRNPGPNFSSKWYLETYPEAQDAGLNPLVHYLRQRQGAQALPFGKRVVYYLRSGLTAWKQEGFRAAWQKVGLKLRKLASPQPVVMNELLDQAFPDVSIVIPVFNALPMTQACLASLLRETGTLNIEILVVDNASIDGTAEWLAGQQLELPNLKVIRNAHNLGFGPAVNLGLQRSRGEFIVILNNDTLVSPGWLANLLAAMQADPGIGILSPSTNYVGEGPQIDPQAQELPADPAAIAEYARGLAGRETLIYEPNRLVFFCVLLRRELVDLIGYLDEGYAKGNFEDDDYCLRARMAGYRLAIARNSFVYHHGTATFKLNRISHNQWMEINRGRFYRKAGRIATSARPWQPAESRRVVSVIVRTKDRPQLLSKALTSLANQTYRDFEVVLVNDGGADISDLLAGFEPYFPINSVHHQASRGRTAAINAGLENARGKWIAYLDDDDILYPWHFEVLVHKAESSAARAVYSDFNRVLFSDSTALFPSRLVGSPPWEFNRQAFLVQNYLPIHTYIHLRASVDQVGPWNESLDRLEDYEFLLRLGAVSEFQHAKKVTCEYRYYLDSVNSISQGREGYLTALQHVYDLHPIQDARLADQRQEILDGLRAQTRRIDELLKNVGSSPAEQFAAHREIILLTTGM